MMVIQERLAHWQEKFKRLNRLEKAHTGAYWAAYRRIQEEAKDCIERKKTIPLGLKYGYTPMGFYAYYFPRITARHFTRFIADIVSGDTNEGDSGAEP
jgi:hypothetical protein